MIIHLKVHSPLPSEPRKKALHVQSRSYWAPANIGPYSQAISIPIATAEEENPGTWTVSVAGQIPLIPHTMLLPEVSTSTIGQSSTMDPMTANFNLQVVLSLQHLCRIGIDMNVGWWTGAVVYLPRGPLDTIREKAIVASKAWSFLHKQEMAKDDDDNDDSGDTWEERNDASMGMWGGEKTEARLPDWSMVEGAGTGAGSAGRNIDPPFFAVEIDELPRQSGVEWHAFSGIVKGPVKVYIYIYIFQHFQV